MISHCSVLIVPPMCNFLDIVLNVYVFVQIPSFLYLFVSTTMILFLSVSGMYVPLLKNLFSNLFFQKIHCIS